MKNLYELMCLVLHLFIFSVLTYQVIEEGFKNTEHPVILVFAILLNLVMGVYYIKEMSLGSKK